MCFFLCFQEEGILGDTKIWLQLIRRRFQEEWLYEDRLTSGDEGGMSSPTSSCELIYCQSKQGKLQNQIQQKCKGIWHAAMSSRSWTPTLAADRWGWHIRVGAVPLPACIILWFDRMRLHFSCTHMVYRNTRCLVTLQWVTCSFGETPVSQPKNAYRENSRHT